MEKKIHFQDDNIITERTEDVSSVLDFTKEQRAAQTNCSKDLHHVARVPMIIIQKLIDEGRLNNDVFRDRDQMAKALQIISQEYPSFMATEKKVL